MVREATVPTHTLEIDVGQGQIVTIHLEPPVQLRDDDTLTLHERAGVLWLVVDKTGQEIKLELRG